MQHILSDGDIKDYIDKMRPLDGLSFVRDSEKTYPIESNLLRPKDLRGVRLSINSLVLGQFIMIEQIITGKTKLPDHLVDLELLKLISRPIHHNEFDNENPVEEKKNQERILDMDVRECYWILTEFINNREKTLFKDFAGVFYDAPDEEDEKNEENNEDPEEKTSDMLFNQQWYWYSIVRMLANEDITRYGEIYMLPMNTVLPEMSYLAQKNKIESAKQRQSQAMRKL
jgi:hypothetical protein